MTRPRIYAEVPVDLKRKAQIRATEKDKTIGEYIICLVLKDLEESGLDQRYTPIKRSNGD